MPVLDGVKAEFVDGSVCAAAFDAAAGHPHSGAVGMMIAAVGENL